MTEPPKYEDSFESQTLNVSIKSNDSNTKLIIKIPPQSFDKLSETYAKLNVDQPPMLCFLEDSADIPDILPTLVILYKDLCASPTGQVIYPYKDPELTPEKNFQNFVSLATSLATHVQRLQDCYFYHSYPEAVRALKK